MTDINNTIRLLKTMLIDPKFRASFNQKKPIDLHVPPKPSNKVPPVYVDRTTMDFKKQMFDRDDIKAQELKHNFIKIIPKDLEKHKKIVQTCVKNNYKYYTYGIPNKRKLKVCIKGLPDDVDLNAVKSFLKTNDIPVNRVHRMHTKPGLVRPTLILAVLDYNEKAFVVFNINAINDIPVIVQRLVPRIGQCHRCQRWGHSQRYCTLTPKCVKCACDHITKKCKNKPEDPTVCANCNGNHTANYRLCPVAVKYQDKNERVKL